MEATSAGGKRGQASSYGECSEPRHEGRHPSAE